MSHLQSSVEAYLSSAGYTFLQQREGLLVADRWVLGGLRDTWLVWVPPKLVLLEDYRRAESGLLGDFHSLISKYPSAKYSVLTPGGAGFSKNFRTEASRLGVSLTVPIYFFDAPYRSELDTKYKSAVSSLRESHRPTRRVSQPYGQVVDGDFQTEGEDLFSELIDEISSARQPCLRIIVGPAGIGKSVLFNAVFNTLFERFQEHKLHRQVFPRPIPLLPSYLDRTSSFRVPALIEAFLRTEVAAPVSPAAFQWMLCNGFSTWLFDGLDELYASDSEFFFYLLELFTRPQTQAQVLLCARESLLTSSITFSEFLEEFPESSEAVRVYRLKNWDRKSKRTFVWLGLEGRLPKPEEQDSDGVMKFLNWIDGTPALKTLSGVPYYCSLMLDEWQKGKAKDYATDFELMEYSVSAMVQREEDKGVIPLDYFEPDGLSEWLNEVAFHHYSRGFAGIPAQEVADMAELVLGDNLSAEKKRHALMSLVQFPLFKRGLEDSTVAFEHELVCEYLAARFILGRIAIDPSWAARSLAGQTDLSSSLMTRFLAAHLPLQAGALQAIANVLRSGVLFGRAFANFLQVLLLSDPRSDLMQEFVLEGRDLSNVAFTDRDLAGISLRSSNLNNTKFIRCNMQNAQFQGAHFVATSFLELGNTALRGAGFGDLERFNYIFVGKRKLEDLQQAAEWVRSATASNQQIKQPCPAAQQLRILFMKFIDINGAAKRDELWEEDLSRGKRISGAPTPLVCIEAAKRFGYLRESDRPKRVRRTTGDKYGDMVQFVSFLRMADQLRELLNSLCDRKQCEHVPTLGSTAKRGIAAA